MQNNKNKTMVSFMVGAALVVASIAATMVFTGCDGKDTEGPAKNFCSNVTQVKGLVDSVCALTDTTTVAPLVPADQGEVHASAKSVEKAVKLNELCAKKETVFKPIIDFCGSISTADPVTVTGTVVKE